MRARAFPDVKLMFTMPRKMSKVGGQAFGRPMQYNEVYSLR